MNIDKLIDAIPRQSAEDRRAVRINAARIQTSGSDAQKKAAHALISALNQCEAGERGDIVSRISNMDIAARVIEAFRVMPPTDDERRVLEALLNNPGCGTLILSQICGWKDQIRFNGVFGKLCRKREVYLGSSPDKYDATGEDFYSSILADVEAKTLRYTLKPGVAAALAEIGRAHV